MPRRISTSQLRSQIQQARNKQRQAIQRNNNAVRRFNAKRKQQVDSYNRAARAYNSRVRANRSRLQSALQRLSQQSVNVRYRTLYQSSLELSASYQQLDASEADPFLSDLAEREAANSATLVNALFDDSEKPQDSDADLAASKITGHLSNFPEDLQSRWAGAIFSLSPANPDAARHFCSSAREIIAEILSISAPDQDVLAEFPDAPLTGRGNPTRRARVQFCLHRNGLADTYLESFIEANIKDLNILFDDLNSGTHGAAGKFSFQQLIGIKKRAEDSIEFICEIAS